MILEIAKHALMITGFVLVMMLVVEYVNVYSSGAWQKRLSRTGWTQYAFAALLGLTPGCLGAFAVVAMYSHGVVSLGAVVAAMIATSGDEAFVMLAMIPRQALVLFAILLALGLTGGIVADRFAGRFKYGQLPGCRRMTIHPAQVCDCFPRGKILGQWKDCSLARGIMALVLAIYMAGLITGQLGPAEWNWIRITLIVVSAAALFIVSTVPDHFLEEHLWQHVARKHALRIFAWTFAALLVVHLLTRVLQLSGFLHEGKWLLLLAACLIGLIPESGPHLVFVTLFAQGAISPGILLANSIVQDGHGMLPLLAEDRRAFIFVKAVNFAAGLLSGGVALGLGF